MKLYDKMCYEVWIVGRDHATNELQVEVLARTALLAHAMRVYEEHPLAGERGDWAVIRASDGRIVCGGVRAQRILQAVETATILRTLASASA